MSDIMKMVLAGLAGAFLGCCITAAVLDKEGAVRWAEVSTLYDVSIRGNMLYLGCLQEDCREELIARNAVASVADAELCKRGVVDSCARPLTGAD